MTRAVKTVEIEASVGEAVKKMNKFRIGSIVVVDSTKRRPLGILTERDILRLVEVSPAPMTDRVKEVMSRQLVTIDPSAGVEEAAGLMTRRGVKRLPVMENDELVGIITSSDIIRANPTLVKALMDLLKHQT